jgi:hypothetical protein
MNTKMNTKLIVQPKNPNPENPISYIAMVWLTYKNVNKLLKLSNLNVDQLLAIPEGKVVNDVLAIWGTSCSTSFL